MCQVSPWCVMQCLIVVTRRRIEHADIQHGMRALRRRSVYSRLAGYDDLNDAERLAIDPVMRQVIGGRSVDHAAASTSQMARFETEVLTSLGGPPP